MPETKLLSTLRSLSEDFPNTRVSSWHSAALPQTGSRGGAGRPRPAPPRFLTIIAPRKQTKFSNTGLQPVGFQSKADRDVHQPTAYEGLPNLQVLPKSRPFRQGDGLLSVPASSTAIFGPPATVRVPVKTPAQNRTREQAAMPRRGTRSDENLPRAPPTPTGDRRACVPRRAPVSATPNRSPAPRGHREPVPRPSEADHRRVIFDGADAFSASRDHSSPPGARERTQSPAYKRQPTARTPKLNFSSILRAPGVRTPEKADRGRSTPGQPERFPHCVMIRLTHAGPNSRPHFKI